MSRNKLVKIAEGMCAPTFRGMYTLVQGSSYTQATAGLELDDNSVDARAKLCHTHIHGEHGYTTRIVKTDNGAGMTADELQAAYQMAGDKKDRTEDAIGGFLMGMKGATLSQCKDITIVTHKNGTITCLHTDVDAQLAQNSFEPTEFVTHATRDHLLNYIHPSDVDQLLSSPSGTLVQMKNFLPEVISNVDSTITNLTSAISAAYPHLHSIKFTIQKDNEEPVEIPRLDLFYHTMPSAVKNRCEITLRLYKPNVVGASSCRVIEYVTQSREYHGGAARAGQYYEHFIRKEGQQYCKGMELVTADEVERIKPNLLGTIDANMIEVTDATYFAEQKAMPDVNQKGFHMMRNNRKVSAALALGYDIRADNESHAHRPRQRMEVRFPPSLDKIVGSTWNKAMRDGPLAQPILGDALYRIFRQRGDAWAKQSILDAKKVPTHQFVAESDAESDGTDAETEPPTVRTFQDIVVPKTPAVQPDTPATQLVNEVEEEEEELEADAPLAPPPAVSQVAPPVAAPTSLLSDSPCLDSGTVVIIQPNKIQLLRDKLLGVGILTPDEESLLRDVFDAYVRPS